MDLPTDTIIDRALPELSTLLTGIGSVATLPETDPKAAADPHLRELIRMCREITRLHSSNKTPLAVYLLALAAAARVPRSIIRMED